MELKPQLTNSQRNLCEYGGGFGVALSLTCLIQHIIFAIPSPITYPMIPAYIFAIVAFVLFAIQKPISIALLIISGIFSFIIEYVWIAHASFSVVVIMLFVYHLVIVITSLLDGLPNKMKMKRAAEKAERDMWNGKI